MFSPFEYGKNCYILAFPQLEDSVVKMQVGS